MKYFYWVSFRSNLPFACIESPTTHLCLDNCSFDYIQAAQRYKQSVITKNSTFELVIHNHFIEKNYWMANNWNHTNKRIFVPPLLYCDGIYRFHTSTELWLLLFWLVCCVLHLLLRVDEHFLWKRTSKLQCHGWGFKFCGIWTFFPTVQQEPLSTSTYFEKWHILCATFGTGRSLIFIWF